MTIPKTARKVFRNAKIAHTKEGIAAMERLAEKATILAKFKGEILDKQGITKCHHCKLRLCICQLRLNEF